MAKEVRRLFSNLSPESYVIEIAPSTENMSFSGKMDLNFTRKGRPSRRITLHQKGLKIIKARIFKISKGTEEEIEVVRFNVHKSYDELRIHTEKLMTGGVYRIYLEFTGEITDAMHGLYPCYFRNGSNKKVLLATQFESHHAREVFPCIDEPEAKATFALTILAPEKHTVLSNTDVAREEEVGGGIKRTIFKTTPRMSTYLLAFVIGDLHCKSAQTKDGIMIRTWGTVEQPLEFMKYANDEAVRLLEYFTDYFGIPFPLDKCDQVALPDFESGAMENWGLITYREIALLADPVNKSLTSEQYVSMVVAHELSHQWFGNLVTMKWWDDLWLNESFASLMEHIALDALHPDWFQWEQYTASDVISCSNRDVFRDVQPVRVKVSHPDEISTLFDPAIVYAKGGRLLKMLREYIGDDNFRAGLKSYFKKYAYQNTTGDDLWTSFAEHSNKDIKAFMHPWLTQSGMPLVKLKKQNDQIRLTQERLLLDGVDDKSIWPIPLLAKNIASEQTLSSKEMELSLKSDEPVVLNVNGSAHMAVRYLDESSRNHIARMFSNQQLAPETRVNTLNDSLLLSRAGIAPLTESFNLIKNANSEPRDAVWLLISRILSTAISLTEGDDFTEKNIKLFRQELAIDWYKELGWDDQPDDTPNTKGLRLTILSLMVASDSEVAIEESIKRYRAAKSVEDLPSDLRAIISSAVVRHGDKKSVQELIDLYKSTSNPDLQLAICSGVTSVKDQALGEWLINASIGKDGFVRPQDIFRWYAYFMRNRFTRNAAWEWLTSDWERLERLFGDSKSFEYFVVTSASPLNTNEWLDKFRNFFEPKKDIVALKRNILVALAEIEARIEWRRAEQAGIKEYFAR